MTKPIAVLLASGCIACLLAASVQIVSAKPVAHQDECFRKSLDYLNSIAIPEQDDAQWQALIEKSRQYYPELRDLLALKRPSKEYLRAMQAMGAQLPECDQLIVSVQRSVVEVPGFIERFSEHQQDFLDLMTASDHSKRVAERFLICEYATSRVLA